jgi:hypothetical protein
MSKGATMSKAVVGTVVLLAVSAILGATVFREQIARAAPPITSVFVTNDESSPVPVRERNLDADGNIKVHEQGTANVSIQGVASVKLTEQPFEQTVLLLFQAGGDRTASEAINVPEGKLLTIRYVSARDDFDAALTELRLDSPLPFSGDANPPVIDQPGDLEVVSEELLFLAGSGLFKDHVTAVRDAPATFTEGIPVLLVGTLSDA